MTNPQTKTNAIWVPCVVNNFTEQLKQILLVLLTYPYSRVNNLKLNGLNVPDQVFIFQCQAWLTDFYFNYTFFGEIYTITKDVH